MDFIARCGDCRKRESGNENPSKGNDRSLHLCPPTQGNRDASGGSCTGANSGDFLAALQDSRAAWTTIGTPAPEVAGQPLSLG